MTGKTRTGRRGLDKCLACGAVAVKHHRNISNAAAWVELSDISVPFVSTSSNRVFGRVTVEVFSIDPLHKGDLSLVPHVLQRGLDRFLQDERF